MNYKKISKILILLVSLFIPYTIYAVDGNPGSRNNWNNTVTYKGNRTITSSINEDSQTYSSTTGNVNALLVSGGSSTINNPSISKSGDAAGDNADFYGTNAAILAYNNANLNITNGTINTNGGHANAVFAYGTGSITLNNTSINTTNNNSGGIMVSGGGRINAYNLNVKTSGRSSAAIRSDRGGGTITTSQGTYETSGVGSPAIYSTAYIIANGSNLISTASEGIIVEGANSVILNNVTLTDTNTTLNGHSETYKNIFLYQSGSGDASHGNAEFTANKSKITTNKGDTIFVTNTVATITLNDNNIINNDGDFLRIQKGKWGTSGTNGGIVTLNLSKQSVKGNIIVDNISTLDITMKENSALYGAIDKDNQAKNITLTMSNNSILSLTADSYIDVLNNADTTNSNIYLNGHKLYVNGISVTGNNSTANTTNSSSTNNVVSSNNNTQTSNNKSILVYIFVIIIIIALVVPSYIFYKRKNDEQ